MPAEPGARATRRRPPSLFVGGVALAAALVLSALLAPLLAPRDPAEQLDPAATRYLPPGSRLSVVRTADGATLAVDRFERAGDTLRVRRLGEWRTLDRAQVVNLDRHGDPPWRLYLLGSDGFGRDVWSRLLWAGRATLWVAALAALLAMVVGTAVGAIAGFAGPVIDSVLMRLVDALLAFPRLFLVIALAATFDNTRLVVVLVLGLTGWMGVARLVRAQVMSLRGRDFVLAARSLGQSPTRVLVRHLLPNALTPVLIDTALRTGEIVLVEAALSYLGLGVAQPTPSWGNMIADGSSVLASAWWISAFPGAAIVAAVLALHLMADGLRDWLDPQSA